MMSGWDWLAWLLYFVAFLSIVVGWFWTVVLYFNGNAYLKGFRARSMGTESDYLWIFLVPALNEGVTIADSVARLQESVATHKVILVINDGSDDNTGEVLASIHDPDLFVLTRVPPNARVGKAAALNHAYQFVLSQVLNDPRFAEFDADHVILGIVDADGRLDPEAPHYLPRHFDRDEVGGVQASVRIYNTDSWLTRVQHLEFGIFGGLFQLGRSNWGTAFMGGNGQFNRLSALQDIATDEGPWSHFLTEDQELGLRLLRAGWKGEHDPDTFVAQQGLNSLRRLYRQRTRWMQGNLQVFTKVKRVYAYDLVGIRRFDALITIILPVMQIIVGASLIVAIVLFVGWRVAILPLGEPVILALMLMLSMGPIGLGITSLGRGLGWRGVGRVLSVFPSYYLYTFVMWPVVARGLWAFLRGNKTWAKTDREQIAPAPTVVSRPRPPAPHSDQAGPGTVDSTDVKDTKGS